MKTAQEYLNFNRGRISRLGMARVDLKRTSLSAAVQTNWMPRVLGSMMLRPGLGYINTQPGLTEPIPFVFSSTDTAVIEVHNASTSFMVNDVRMSRPTVTAAVNNSTFGASIDGWTVVDAGVTAAWQAGGYAGLAGDGTSVASIQQAVTVVQPGVEHGLRVVVARGPVMMRVGSTMLGAEYIADVELNTGAHSLGFTPSAGLFYIKFFTANQRICLVDSCQVESGGDVNLPSPWGTANLPMLRYDQSGDIVFMACEGVAQKRIVRRASRSWSIDDYVVNDGPLRLENTSSRTLAASGLSGNVTLTSSLVAGSGLFKPGHVGALFSLTSSGQQLVAGSFSAANAFTSHIRVTGIGGSRLFAISVSGTFVANVVLQRSFDEGATWVDVDTYTAATESSLTDALENQIIWYRIGIKTGNYTSGTAVCLLSHAAGSITGIARVTDYVSDTTVSAEVLIAFGGTLASEVWAEGAWSPLRGYPSAVRFHDGRLFWAGKDKFWGSITDQFYTFDAAFPGDAGLISRSIGFGPVDTVNWLMSLDRLVAGTDGAEVACRSSSFNEPLTQTNFTPKNSSTQGSAKVAAVPIDSRGLFVARNERRLYELSYDGAQDRYDAEDLMALVPEVGEPGIVQLAVQRKPDTRVHCLRSDGTVALLVFDRTEKVICWVDVETSGLVSRMCVLPGAEEDFVYYIVKRTVSGADYYYTEKWAFESEARGGSINKLADSFVYGAASASTVTGLGHLEGRSVVAFGGGLDLGAFTVSGGSITLPEVYANRCAGLAYQARFMSTKLAYAAQGRSGLGMKKKIDHLGLVMADTHPQGISFGPSFEKVDPMPEKDRYGAVDLGVAWDAYDSEPVWFPGEWDTDSRLCLVANAPRACTVLAAIIEMEVNAR